MKKLAVVAIGGNSLIIDDKHVEIHCQYQAICATANHIADMIELGYNVVITHGNGPQVGFILRRSELAHEKEGMHSVPLCSCVADTQGAIGFQIQTAMDNELKKRGINKQTACLVTRVMVDKNDAAFLEPSKPIGSFYNKVQADILMCSNADWRMKEDAGRGFRRVVPSPMPTKIMEIGAIRQLVAADFLVIAAGGGGIPMAEGDNGINAIDAVIDKDFATALLASSLCADLFIISTGVPKVYLDYNKPTQRALENINAIEAKKYIDEDHFAKGSMLPKMQAALSFLEARPDAKVLITDPYNLKEALLGKNGTLIQNGGL